MTTIHNIIDYVETLTTHPLNKDEGIHHGKSNRTVKGVTIAWMATPEAIQSAGESKHNLLIAHESLYYPYDVLNQVNPPANWQEWKVNQQRRQLLEKYGLSLLRLHGSVDEICIFDTFAELLGLGKPVHVDKLVKIYEIPPCSLADLTQRVKERMGMSHVRLAGDKTSALPIKRVGLPWGGLGLFVNVGYQQRLVELGCDVFIAGESDNYGFRFAVESGIPMIETSHELCENPGLNQFTKMIAKTFPEMQFNFYENECIWRIV